MQDLKKLTSQKVKDIRKLSQDVRFLTLSRPAVADTQKVTCPDTGGIVPYNHIHVPLQTNGQCLCKEKVNIDGRETHPHYHNKIDDSITDA